MKFVIKHLADSFRPSMSTITYVRTFDELLTRADADAASPSPRVANGSAPPTRRWLNPREPDAAEEAYFNSEDEPSQPPTPTPVKLLNGSPSPPSPAKPLVDYDSDEENVLASPPKKRKAEEEEEEDVLGGLARGVTRKRSFSANVGSDKQGPAKKMAIKVQVKGEELKGA